MGRNKNVMYQQSEPISMICSSGIHIYARAQKHNVFAWTFSAGARFYRVATGKHTEWALRMWLMSRWKQTMNEIWFFFRLFFLGFDFVWRLVYYFRVIRMFIAPYWSPIWMYVSAHSGTLAQPVGASYTLNKHKLIKSVSKLNEAGHVPNINRYWFYVRC